MNKAELIEKIAGDAGISKKQANASLDSFTEAVAKKVYYGPVYFRRESEPYMALSVAGTLLEGGAVPLAEGGMWPLQPEPRPQRAPAPADDEANWSVQPEPAPRATPESPPRAQNSDRLAGFSAERPEIKRGIDFLVATQKPDGSWPMISRSTPDGSPGSSKLLTPITCAASSWATLGLARLAPKEN